MVKGKDLSELEWMGLRQKMDDIQHVETNKDKFIRKIKENPFVPVGGIASGIALLCGLWSFKAGRMQMSQQMMRLRVLSHGLTVTALVTGLLATSKAVK